MSMPVHRCKPLSALPFSVSLTTLMVGKNEHWRNYGSCCLEETGISREIILSLMREHFSNVHRPYKKKSLRVTLTFQVFYVPLLVADVRTYECITNWISHESEVFSVQFSGDEATCFTMGAEGKVRLSSAVLFIYTFWLGMAYEP